MCAFWKKRPGAFKRLGVISFFALMFAILPANAMAEYSKGNYQINLRVPLSIPTFTYLQVGEPDNHSGQTLTFSDMGFKGIQGGVEADVGYFLNDKLSVGGILGYDFAYDRGGRILSKVPILCKANYILFSQGIAEVPASAFLGVNYWKYHSQEHFVLHAGVEIGVNAFWSESWGAMFRTGFWIYPELYADSYKSNISGFIPIILGVTYRR